MAGACGFFSPALVFPPECTAGQTACPEGKPARVRKIHVHARGGCTQSDFRLKPSLYEGTFWSG